MCHQPIPSSLPLPCLPYSQPSARKVVIQENLRAVLPLPWPWPASFGRRHVSRQMIGLCERKCFRSESTWPKAKKEMIRLMEKISLMNVKNSPEVKTHNSFGVSWDCCPQTGSPKHSGIRGRKAMSFPLCYLYFNIFLPLTLIAISHTNSPSSHLLAFGGKYYSS